LAGEKRIPTGYNKYREGGARPPKNKVEPPAIGMTYSGVGEFEYREQADLT